MGSYSAGSSRWPTATEIASSSTTPLRTLITVSPAMKRQLADLVAQGKRLLLPTHPSAALILRVLGALSTEDVRQLEGGHLLDANRLGDISKSIGEHPDSVKETLYNRIRWDLQDYSSYHESARQSYIRSGISESWLLDFFGRHGEAGTIYFLLHHQLRTWNPLSQDFAEFVIEESDEDDELPAAVEGYLVTKGLGYSTSVDLLDVSRRDSWANWQGLWSWF